MISWFNYIIINIVLLTALIIHRYLILREKKIEASSIAVEATCISVERGRKNRYLCDYTYKLQDRVYECSGIQTFNTEEEAEAFVGKTYLLYTDGTNTYDKDTINNKFNYIIDIIIILCILYVSLKQFNSLS